MPQRVAVTAPCKCQQLINFSLIPAADEPVGQVMGCGDTLLWVQGGDGDTTQNFSALISLWFSTLGAGDQRSSVVNESSSLLGGSPRRQCGRKGSPYHTGQLHPAVRVADLLQHINQMKTAEGYGFKQEYEVRDVEKTRFRFFGRF